MNWRTISVGLLLGISLTTGANPAEALNSQYGPNLSQDIQALNVSDDGGVIVAQRYDDRRDKRESNKNRKIKRVQTRQISRRVNNRRGREFKRVCTNKRIRVRGRIRVVQECRLVRFRR
ncbi:MAG: hypothetical protein AAF208_07045 [Cyanobacteria bacterium P01_A01_bin.45]